MTVTHGQQKTLFDLERYRWKMPPPPPPPPRIVFTDEQWAEVEALAEGRMRRAASMGARHKFQAHSGHKQHVLGAMGEIALSIYLDHQLPDEDVEGFSSDYDLEVSGVTIEVKSSGCYQPRLYMTNGHLGASAAVLVRVLEQPRIAILCGWVTREEFLAKARWGESRYGRHLVMKRGFRRLEELKEMLRA